STTPPCDNLQDAQANNSINPSATLGQLLADSSGAANPTILQNLVIGMVSRQALPIEQMPLADIVASAPLPATGSAHYQIDFDLGCGGAAGLKVAPALPPDF